MSGQVIFTLSLSLSNMTSSSHTAMGFQRFEIVLNPEQPVYVAGSAVSGYLSVSTPEEIECKGA